MLECVMVSDVKMLCELLRYFVFNTRMTVRSFLSSTENSIGCKIINSA